MITVDVAVIGGGVTGLMAAHKLSQLGMSVAIIEKETQFAAGPSTRNEGWLHRGTYHSASIKDLNTAVQVAKRCIYGHEQLRRFCPEAVEEAEIKPIALIRSTDRVENTLYRWKLSEVQYREISKGEAARLTPEANFNSCAGVYEVADVSINTRLLYRKLLSALRLNGCKVYLGHSVIHLEDDTATLRSLDEQELTLRAQKYIYASGAGTKDVFYQLHKIDLPLRFWKSHLIITRRLTQRGVFYIDPHEPAMMNHGDYSIVGFNEDAFLTPSPSYSLVDQNVQNIKRGIYNLFPNWDSDGTLAIACVKVDFSPQNEDRSLNVAIAEPVKNHICILPGKMTEAPYLTDTVVSYLHSNLDTAEVALRPCDLFAKGQLQPRTAVAG